MALVARHGGAADLELTNHPVQFYLVYLYHLSCVEGCQSTTNPPTMLYQLKAFYDTLPTTLCYSPRPLTLLLRFTTACHAAMPN